jgi:GST-like protein
MAEDRFHLYGARAGGSAIVEAMLTIADLPFAVTDLDWKEVFGSSAAVLRANPVGQIPALVLPDGRTMTETAAIALYLSEIAPAAGLAPPPGDAARPVFLRWLIALVAQIYPTFTYGDAPQRWVGEGEASERLRAATDARANELWKIVETELSPGPWMLGPHWSALDLFAAVMTRWRPRRAWFEQECPKLFAVAERVDAMAKLQAVWSRHYS